MNRNLMSSAALSREAFGLLRTSMKHHDSDNQFRFQFCLLGGLYAEIPMNFNLNKWF